MSCDLGFFVRLLGIFGFGKFLLAEIVNTFLDKLN